MVGTSAREVEIVRIRVEPSRAAELVQAIELARDGYLAAPACHKVELLLTEERDEVVAIVTWCSAEAHAQSLRSPLASSFFETVSGYALEAPQVHRYYPARKLD